MSAKIYKVFEYALFTGIILAYGLLIYMAFTTQYTGYIKTHPLRFIGEFLAFSLLPALPLILFVTTRNVSTKAATIWFATLWFKFALLHVLFELSGVYHYYFGSGM